MKKVLLTLIGSLFTVASAQAALIEVDIAYGVSDAQAAEQKLLQRAAWKAMDGGAGAITEDFNGFDLGNGVYTGGQQAEFVDKNSEYNTAVGMFKMVLPEESPESADRFIDELMIESTATGEFGRDISKSDDDFWLDSNDAAEVSWDISGVNTSFNSLGFFIADANDNGARLVFRFTDGSTAEQSISLSSGGLSNGNVAYITLVSSMSIADARIIFDNNGDSTRKPNDGWSLDNASIAEVSAPATIALLGMAILALVSIRRR